MKSLNQIIAELEAFANVHYQIHTFGHGDIWEATPNSSEIVYPILWLVPTGATTGLREVTTNFTVICMDLVRSGEENETEVLSDTLQIILDVVSYYRQQHNQTYIVEFGSNIQPFTESHPDMLAGHSITVSIRQPFTYNECAIPFSGAPTPLVPSCADATVQNAASNPTYQASIESGGNLVLPQVKVLDSDGVTDILANYIPNADGYVAECSVPTCADATVEINGVEVGTVPSGGTDSFPVIQDGSPVGSWNGTDWIIPSCPVSRSLSITISDLSPNIGETITISATPSGITPNNYLFIAEDGTDAYVLADQAGSSYDWEVDIPAGNWTIHVIATDGTNDVADCEDIVIATTYLLDLYPNAAYAFSHRKLRSDYTGFAAQVRRSSDNATQDIGFVSDEIDISAISTFVGAGNGFALTWYDQSGNSRNATQVTAGDQPTMVVSGTVQTANGKSILVFDGSNSFMSLTAFMPQPSTYFIVAKTNNASQTQVLISSDNSNARHQISLTGGQYAIFAGTILTGGSANTNEHLYSAIFNGASSELRVDGVSIITGNAGSQTVTNPMIGAFGVGGIPWNGYIKTVIGYDSDQSANFAAIESLINGFSS